MGKSIHFTGQPIFNQLLFYIQGVNINKIANKYDAERYVKKFDTHKHLIAMLFGVIEGYHSLRELVIGLLSNAHKPAHIGMGSMVRRSTLSDANGRRKSAVFGNIYMAVYAGHCESLSDRRLKKPDIKRLFAMDSTTITLFKEILKGCGRLPVEGKRKGGIKAHTVIDLSNNIPCLIRYTEAARQDHVLLPSSTFGSRFIYHL